MAFFTIAFFWIFGLFLVTGILFVLFLFLVYHLTGGKRSFRSWYRAMQFWQFSPWVYAQGLFCYALLSPSAPLYGLFMPCPMYYHCRPFSVFAGHSTPLQEQSILKLFPGPLSGFFLWGYMDIGDGLKTPWRGSYGLIRALYPVDMVCRGILLFCLVSCDGCMWFTIKLCSWSKCIN